MEEDLKQEVLEAELAAYNEKYRSWLRKKYGLSDKHLSTMIPDDLQPFAYR